MRARPVAEVPRVREWTYRVETVVEKESGMAGRQVPDQTLL